MGAIRKTLRICADHRGATAIEYGLIAALIAVAIVGALKNLGGGSSGMWTKISDQVQDAAGL